MLVPGTTIYDLSYLTVPLEFQIVASLPGSMEGSTNVIVGAMSLFAQSSRFASGAGESSQFSVLVNWIDDPLDAWVVSDAFVCWIDKDDFIILHGSILIDPIGIENTQIGILASDLLFCHGLQVAFELEMVDTGMFWFSENHTAMILTLATTATDTTTDNHKARLGFETQTVGLIRTSGLVDAGDLVALTIFPSADAKEETKGVRLLVTPQFLEELVSWHGGM
jgi:hypothetical protein